MRRMLLVVEYVLVLLVFPLLTVRLTPVVARIPRGAIINLLACDECCLYQFSGYLSSKIATPPKK